jgi:hypothetical protein
MKKLLVLFFALQFISNQTFAMELVRLPALFIHYHDENEAYTDFFDFLSEHYGHDDHDEAEHDHHNLPFKHCGGCCANHLIAPAFCGEAVAMTLAEPHYSRVSFFLSDQSIKNQFLNNIWQPPKIS